MRRRPIILTAVAVSCIAGLFVPLRGLRLIGFRYAVQINNLDTECPRTVTALSGNQITLDDGRILLVNGPTQEDLRGELERCEYRVRIDDAEQGLYTAQRIRFCGFDYPQSCQFITIRLSRVELRQYTSHGFGSVRQVQATSDK